MFSVGEFARHGRISVRMLRHNDAIRLLQPAHVDPVSGYRFYEARQLSDLNRIIALKDLGFTLLNVRAILDEQVSAAELRGMLRLRRAEIHAQIEAETARLARVGARLLSIEDEDRAPADGVVIKHLAPVRVAELTGVAQGYQPEHITPVIQALYRDLFARVCRAGVDVAGPGDKNGYSILDLPAIERAATIIHHGTMDDVLPTGQALARWIDASGHRSAGCARELTIEWSADPEQWVTELQQPIRPAGDEPLDQFEGGK